MSVHERFPSSTVRRRGSRSATPPGRSPCSRRGRRPAGGLGGALDDAAEELLDGVQIDVRAGVAGSPPGCGSPCPSDDCCARPLRRPGQHPARRGGADRRRLRRRASDRPARRARVTGASADLDVERAPTCTCGRRAATARDRHRRAAWLDRVGVRRRARRLGRRPAEAAHRIGGRLGGADVRRRLDQHRLRRRLRRRRRPAGSSRRRPSPATSPSVSRRGCASGWTSASVSGPDALRARPTTARPATARPR